MAAVGSFARTSSGKRGLLACSVLTRCSFTCTDVCSSRRIAEVNCWLHTCGGCCCWLSRRLMPLLLLLLLPSPSSSLLLLLWWLQLLCGLTLLSLLVELSGLQKELQTRVRDIEYYPRRVGLLLLFMLSMFNLPNNISRRCGPRWCFLRAVPGRRLWRCAAQLFGLNVLFRLR